MANAKNSTSEKNVPNEKLEVLLQEFLEIVNSLDYPWKVSKRGSVSQDLLLKVLFGNFEEPNNSNFSSVVKINTPGHPLQHKDINNCMSTLCKAKVSQIYTITDLIIAKHLGLEGYIKKSFENLPEDFTTNFNHEYDEYTYDNGYFKELTNKLTNKHYIDQYYTIIYTNNKTLWKRISSLYNKYAPYPWIHEDDNNSDPISLTLLYRRMIYLITSIGLRTNNVKNTSAFYTETSLPLGFEKFLSEKSAIFFYGPPSCGKTAFLKNYAQHHNSSVFYIDTKTLSASNEYETILQTLRPDYTFWKSLVPDDIKAAFQNPWGETSEISPLFLSHKLTREDTLILDNISAKEQISHYLDFLPCHLIFVSNSIDLCCDKDVLNSCDIYDFCKMNHDNYGKIFSGMLAKASKTMPRNDLDSELITKICSNIDYNLYVYRLIALNYNKIVENNSFKKGMDFLNTIAYPNEIETLNRSINTNKYGSHKLSMNYHGKLSGRYLRDYIEFIYKDYLTEEQRRILHLLYRCQTISGGNIRIEDFMQFLNSSVGSDLLAELVHLGWISSDKSQIPLVIATSLNNISLFTNSDYSTYLKIFSHYSWIMKGFDKCTIQKESCIALIEGLHHEYIGYIKGYGKKAAQAAKKYFYKHLNEMSPEESSKFRATGISEKYYSNPDDPIDDSQFMDWLIISNFYTSAISFCLQYNNFELAHELYLCASDPSKISFYTKNSINQKIWNLQLEILANSITIPYYDYKSLQNAFCQYANYHSYRKNELPRRYYDDVQVIRIMYYKVLFDFQRDAYQIWKNTITESTSKCIHIQFLSEEYLSPFYWFTSACEIFNLDCLVLSGFSKECLLLFNLYTIFYEMMFSMCYPSVNSTPVWEIAASDNDIVQSYSIYTQYYVLYLAMRIYYYAFIDINHSYVSASQTELNDILSKEQIGDLPTYIREAANYALNIYPIANT